VISVALKTPLKNKMRNLYLQNVTSASAWWLYRLYIKLSPHILQQNCAHVWTNEPKKFFLHEVFSHVLILNPTDFLYVGRRTDDCYSC